MKRILLILTMLFSLSFAHAADVYIYKTTGFAMKSLRSNGYWGAWSDWEPSDMYISINFDTSIIKIFSPQTQTYKITEYVKSFTDSDGGEQVQYKFIDQDGDMGTMRLRIEKSGNSQIYIEFSNIMWVYNVKRIQ